MSITTPSALSRIALYCRANTKKNAGKGTRTIAAAFAKQSSDPKWVALAAKHENARKSWADICEDALKTLSLYQATKTADPFVHTRVVGLRVFFETSHPGRRRKCPFSKTEAYRVLSVAMGQSYRTAERCVASFLKHNKVVASLA
jgi:hypothetical protein